MERPRNFDRFSSASLLIAKVQHYKQNFSASTNTNILRKEINSHCIQEANGEKLIIQFIVNYYQM